MKLTACYLKTNKQNVKAFKFLAMHARYLAFSYNKACRVYR